MLIDNQILILKLFLPPFRGYLDVIERALACGETVLIENLPEKVDPVLEPLLGRNTIKKGRFVLKLQHHISFGSRNEQKIIHKR